MSSGGLTEEQRKRMEINRQKALQKRAEAAAKAKGNPGTTQNPPSANGYQFKSGPGTTYSNPKPAVLASTLNTVKPVQNVTLQSNKHKTSPSKSTQAQSRPAFSGASIPPVTGTCRLISRDRFAVDLPWSKYYQEANNLFKEIKGNQFDTATKKWHFPISEHGNFLLKMEVLKPNVYIGGVPSFVLNALRQSGGTKQPSDINLSQSSIDPVLQKMLMPFQTEGVRFGISREGRVLIADDMGLGKTIQALGIAHYYYSEWPLLIVTPSSMRYAWRESIWNWLPSVNAGSVAVIESNNDSVNSARVIIMSYDLLSKKAEDLANIRVVIIDESHHLKNFKTARAKAALPILQNAKRAILLSGTPALSRPIELYTQLTAINRRLFPGIPEYGVRYCAGKQSAWGWDYTGASNMQELQLVLEATCMIRRLKSDVLQQLPSKRRQMLILDPSLVKLKSKSLQSTAKSFEMAQNKPKSMEKRGKLLEYYSETGRAKVDAIAAYVKDLVEDKKKFLCFAHHKLVLDGVCEALESVKCRYIRIDGSTPSEERNKLVELFQYSDSVLVAVLSITAANSGITLTAAHLVVFAELFWNPGILTQAEDRAHRIGQMDSVLIQYLVASGTADDVLWPMVQGKLDVLNKAGLSKDNFSEADTNSLVQANNPQKGIQDFFQPLSASQNNANPANAQDSIADDDDEAFPDDDEMLLQLLEESFNESNEGKIEAPGTSFKSPNNHWGNTSSDSSTNLHPVQPKKLKM